MEKDIKDYLHLYLGCEIVGTGKKPGAKHYTLVGVTIDGGYLFKTIPEGFSIDLGSDWKPVLRPLSDMTEEEKNILEKSFLISGAAKRTIVYEAERTHYLLSKGFDLFGLIESGLAIDKTLLNQGEGSQRSVATEA